MERYVTVIAFVLLFVFESLIFPAEGRTEDTKLEKDHIIYITSNRDLISTNPAIHSYSLFRNGENAGDQEGFFLPNFNVKKTVNSSEQGNSRTAKSLSIEGEFAPLQFLKFLGELKTDVSQSRGSEADYTLLVGQSVKIDNLKLEAYYRKNNPLVGDRSRGFFFNLDYQPLSWASFIVDVGNERKDRINKSSININRGQFKTVISPLSFAEIVTGVNVNSENTNLSNDTYTCFMRVNNKWGYYTTFIDYQFQYFDGMTDSDTNTLTAGINRIWSKIGAWIKGGSSHKEARFEEDKYFGELGFNYKPFNSFDLQFENRYEKFNSHKNEENKIRFSGGVNFKLPFALPFGIEFQNSVKLSKVVEDGMDYQFMTSVVIPRL